MDKQNDDVCGYQTDTTNQLHETATAVGNDHFQLHTPNNRTTGQEMSNKENPYEQLRTLNSTKDNGYEQRRTSNSNNQNGYEQLRTSDSNKETEYEQLNAPVEKTDHKHAQLRNGKSNQAFEDDEVSKTEETRRETQPRVAVPDGSEERPAVAVSSRTETPATSNTDVIIEETSQNVRNASDMSVVPDGGFRGWLVVLSSFLQYSIAFGTSFSIGVFFVPLRDFFGSSNADTAWLAAVQIGTLFLLGPITSVLVSQYGYRTVSMLGTGIAAISFFISTFSTNLPLLILTFGILGGIGLSFTHLVAVVSVGHYIHKRRAFATGLVVCGGGIGTFAFAPFFDFLLTEYGWKGTLWIQSGVILNGLVFSFAYLPSQTEKSANRKAGANGTNDQDVGGERNVKGAQNQDEQQETGTENNSQKESKYHSKQTELRMEEISTAETGSDVTKTSIGIDKGNVAKASSVNSSDSFFRSLLKRFDFSLIKRPDFVLIWLSVFIWSSALTIPTTFLPPLANDLDIESTRAAFLVSIVGISSIVSRVCTGFVSDQTWANTVAINISALLITGISTAIVPLLKSYGLLAAYCVLFGIGTGSFMALRTPVLVEFLGIESYNSAFGMLCLAPGSAVLLGPPVAGFLSDVTGDYNTSFYVTGAVFCLAGVILLPLRCVAERERKSALKSK